MIAGRKLVPDFAPDDQQLSRALCPRARRNPLWPVWRGWIFLVWLLLVTASCAVAIAAVVLQYIGAAIEEGCVLTIDAAYEMRDGRWK